MAVPSGAEESLSEVGLRVDKRSSWIVIEGIASSYNATVELQPSWPLCVGQPTLMERARTSRSKEEGPLEGEDIESVEFESSS
jgi:hypothetical protein